MKLIATIVLFLIFLFLSHIYLLAGGQWFFQDTSYWPKTSQEALIMINSQLTTFSAYGYYLGFDVGLFAYSRFLLLLIISGLFFVFGSGGSQVAFSVIGVVLSFISFYFFSGLFIKEKDKRWVLALVYCFNPIIFSLQGYTIYFIIAPLFIYSFFRFLNEKSTARFAYLLINIFSAFIWIAYIRFIQSNLILVVPYVIYLLWRFKNEIHWKRLGYLFVIYTLVFAPTFIAFFMQIIAGEKTAFNYASTYGSSVVRDPFIDGFSLFVNFPLDLYNSWFKAIGICFFITLLFGLVKSDLKEKVWILHFSMVLLSLIFFGLANIFGEDLYKYLIGFFPFVTNAPFFALYLLPVPLLLFIGNISVFTSRKLLIGSLFFIILSIIPLLNINQKQFRNIELSRLPGPYLEYFVNSQENFPESTLFIPSHCWSSQYMEELDVGLMCLNFDLRFNSMTLDDPRLAWGDVLSFSDKVSHQPEFTKLKYTHNLKNIIVGSDLRSNPLLGVQKNKYDKEYVEATVEYLSRLEDLALVLNDPFKIYSFKNKDEYDYFIYAASRLIESDSAGNISTSSGNIAVGDFQSDFNEAFVTYKSNFDVPTIYFLQIEPVGSKNNKVLLQFNQSYSTNWKIKKIDAELFAKIGCEGHSEYFMLSKTSRCLIESSLILPLYGLFFGDDVSDATHLKSNNLNNGWVLPVYDNNQYYMIYYEKQSFFVLALLVSFATLIVVTGMGIFYLIRKR